MPLGELGQERQKIIDLQPLFLHTSTRPKEIHIVRSLANIPRFSQIGLQVPEQLAVPLGQ